MLSIYKMFRIVYSANKKNDENFFTVPKSVSSPMTDAAMAMSYANAKAVAQGEDFNGNDGIEDSDELFITTATLSEEFPEKYSAVVNLIKNSEAKINSLSSLEK